MFTCTFISWLNGMSMVPSFVFMLTAVLLSRRCLIICGNSLLISVPSCWFQFIQFSSLWILNSRMMTFWGLLVFSYYIIPIALWSQFWSCLSFQDANIKTSAVPHRCAWSWIRLKVKFKMSLIVQLEEMLLALLHYLSPSSVSVVSTGPSSWKQWIRSHLSILICQSCCMHRCCMLDSLLSVPGFIGERRRCLALPFTSQPNLCLRIAMILMIGCRWSSLATLPFTYTSWHFPAWNMTLCCICLYPHGEFEEASNVSGTRRSTMRSWTSQTCVIETTGKTIKDCQPFGLIAG